MPNYHEHPSQWMPKHALGKRLDLDLSFAGPAEEYIPYSPADAIATIRESGMFQDLLGHRQYAEMVEEEAHTQWPELFPSSQSSQEERPQCDQRADVPSEIKTHYVVFSEPSLLHALQMYGAGHPEVERALKGADPGDHLRLIDEKVSNPVFVRNERNVALADLALSTLTDYVVTQRLEAEMAGNSYPVDSYA